MSLGILLTLPVGTPATVPTPPPGPSAARTRATFLAFLRAYNRHELSHSLRFFTHPLQGAYYDCDFASLTPVTVTDLGSLRSWLQVQFAQGDRFSAVRVEADNPEQPYVAAITATRSNDILDAMGIGPLADPIASKFVLDARRGDRIVGGGWAAANWCGNPHSSPTVVLRFPQGPSQMQTRALARAFLDAYNGRLEGRVLSLLNARVRYSDVDYRSRHRIALVGKSQLVGWLRAQFQQHDTLAAPVMDSSSGGEAVRAVIHVERSSRALTAENLAPRPATVTITVGGSQHNRVIQVQITDDRLHRP